MSSPSAGASEGAGGPAHAFRLTVVVPNRNRSAPLVRGVLSVLAQGDEPVEIIVVDDASSEDLSRPYARLEAMGVRVVRLPERRRGSVARNVGARLATGTHLSFLDSDDVWLPGRLQRIKAVAARAGSEGRVHVSGAVLHRSGEFAVVRQPPWRPGSTLVEYVYRDAGRVQTSMLTMPLPIALLHPFDETLRVNQDTDFAMRLDRDGIGFVIDDEPGIIKDESDGADRLSMDPEMADHSLRWFARVSTGWSRGAVQGYHLQDRAWRLAQAGRRREALLALLQANIPPRAVGASIRQAVEIVLGRRAYARARPTFRRLRPSRDPAGVRDGAARWWRDLDARARALVGPDEGAGAGPDPAAAPPAPALARGVGLP